ncbi:MAG: transglutaminaseTgpA domain-containing protein [Pseudonocardiaceae bacterium]
MRAGGPATRMLTALPATAAGLAVALTATSLTAVLTGTRWWGMVVGTIAVVVVTGVLLRWLRTPPIVVATGQLAVLVGLVTAVFTSSSRFVVVPGHTAVAELGSLLGQAARQVRDGIPPVPESFELLGLVVVSFGVIAIAVDILAVSAAAPATAGLVLVGVIAVPTALSDELLPWWSFVLGALGFMLLLLTGGNTDQPVALGRPAPRNLIDAWKPGGAAPAAIAVGAGALVVALLVGASTTAVGTNLPGTGRQISGIGLNPFTSLRGQLDAGSVVDLFRVRGLEQRSYLRGLTLSRFDARTGWLQGQLDAAVPAGDDQQPVSRLPLPVGVAEPVTGSVVRVEIEPINYVDTWLPSFGYPLVLTGIGPGWNYDPDATTIFSERRRRAPPYTEIGVLPQPDPQLLRAAGPGTGAPFVTVDPRYLDTGGVDRRVAELAAQITAGARTAFDAAVAVNQWFSRPGNEFSYDLRTAPGNSGDALVDFLFTGHRGYCEQFASAMAIMLRTVHVPARVAVGFTPGTATGDSRLITTEDAHAWVEVWFPGAGWLPFDPTPLSDGRTVIPGYVAPSGTRPGNVTPPARPPATAPTAPAPDLAAGQPPEPGADSPGSSAGTGLTVVGVLIFAVLAGLAPAGIREFHRRRRLRAVGAGGPDAVSAAWEEVLAEFADRGVVLTIGETVRATAQRLIDEHTLDEAGQTGLHTLVGAVERTWYSKAAPHARYHRALGHRTHQGQETDRELCDALDAVRDSLARCAPMNRTTRLLPRSVLPRRLLVTNTPEASVPRS